MYLLQTDPTALVQGRSGTEFIIGVIGIIIFVVLRETLPLILHHKEKQELKDARAKEKAMTEENNSLIKETGDRLANIENAFSDIKNDISKLFSIVSDQEHLSSKTSEGTLVNHVFNETLWPFLRLKSFRRLLAMKKNGRIWAKGFTLVLNNKEDWLNVLETELGIDIEDEDYYYGRLNEIQKRVFEDFSWKNTGV